MNIVYCNIHLSNVWDAKITGGEELILSIKNPIVYNQNSCYLSVYFPHKFLLFSFISLPFWLYILHSLLSGMQEEGETVLKNTSGKKIFCLPCYSFSSLLGLHLC